MRKKPAMWILGTFFMTLAFVVTSLTWAPPASADVIHIGPPCRGDRVQRCVWVNYDTSTRHFRAHATTHDTEMDGGTFDVAVRWLRLCSALGCTTYNDYDGWQSPHDGVMSGLLPCPPSLKEIWFRAEFAWRGTTDETGPEKSEEWGGSAVVCW